MDHLVSEKRQNNIRYLKSQINHKIIYIYIYVQVEYINQSKKFKHFRFTPYFGDKVYNAVILKNVS